MFFHIITEILYRKIPGQFFQHLQKVLYDSTKHWRRNWTFFRKLLKSCKTKLNCPHPVALHPPQKMQWQIMFLSEIFTFWALGATMIKRKLPSCDYKLKIWILHIQQICFQGSHPFYRNQPKIWSWCNHIAYKDFNFWYIGTDPFYEMKVLHSIPMVSNSDSLPYKVVTWFSKEYVYLYLSTTQ